MIFIKLSSTILLYIYISSLSADDGRLILSSNSDIDISARETLDFIANDIVIKAQTVNK